MRLMSPQRSSGAILMSKSPRFNFNLKQLCFHFNSGQTDRHQIRSDQTDRGKKKVENKLHHLYNTSITAGTHKHYIIIKAFLITIPTADLLQIINKTAHLYHFPPLFLVIFYCLLAVPIKQSYTFYLRGHDFSVWSFVVVVVVVGLSLTGVSVWVNGVCPVADSKQPIPRFSSHACGSKVASLQPCDPAKCTT